MNLEDRVMPATHEGQAEHRQTAGTGTEAGGVLRILTVDDSAAMRSMVAFTLNSAGFEVAQADDGRSALTLIQRERFKLILVDINMPHVDGFQLVQAIRALPEYRFTPVLMLTTEASPGYRGKAAACGATGYLVKPFSPESLIATVRRVLG
jgi:two-component system chemotaxis response regulator CheY